MRVLQLTPVFGSIGGMESYIARLSEALGAQKHTTAVVADDLKPGSAWTYEVVSLPGLAGLEAPYSTAVETEMKQIAAQFQPDVVLIHGAAAPIVSALNAAYPTACFVHIFLCAGAKLFRRGDRACTHPVGPRCLLDWYAGPCGHSRSPKVAIREYQRTRDSFHALREVRSIFVASAFMRDYLIRDGISSDRIAIVSDLDIGIPQEQPMKPPGATRNLLFVGRACYDKGVQYILQALTQLEPPYRLTVVGDGWYLPELKALAQKMGLQERVCFTGFLQGEALGAQYRQADVLVVPSLMPEPAGLVVPEARGRGLRVVAFNVGGIGEWAAKYAGLYLAEPANARSLAETIRKACAAAPCPPYTGSRLPREPLIGLLERFAATGRPGEARFAQVPSFSENICTEGKA